MFYINNKCSSQTKELHTDNTVNKKEILTDHHRLCLFANKNIYYGRYFWNNSWKYKK